MIGKTDEQVAQELDIDRARALSGRVFPEFDEGVHVLESIERDPDVPVELAWDFGLDMTSVLFLQNAPDSVRVIAELEMGSLVEQAVPAIAENVAPRVVEVLASIGLLERDLVPHNLKTFPMVGDPSGQNATLVTGRSLVREYRPFGFVIAMPPRRLTARVDTSIRSVKRLLLGTPKPIRVSREGCPRLILHARNNTWPTDALGHRRVGATAPYDDEHNHAMRALAYWAVARYPPPTEGPKRGPGTDPPDGDGRADPGLVYDMRF